MTEWAKDVHGNRLYPLDEKPAQAPVAWCHTHTIDGVETVQSPFRFDKDGAVRDMQMYGPEVQKSLRVRPLVFGDSDADSLAGAADDAQTWKARCERREADVVRLAEDLDELRGAYETAKRMLAGAVQQREDMRAQLAASDAALRESRQNDAISTATANDLREQVRVLIDTLDFLRLQLTYSWLKEMITDALATVKPKGGE
jgi:hypothetical protein